MSSVPAPREYFLDSIRAWLMLLGIPFHISLIYSTHSWHVNSAAPSWWLTLFNDFIHAFRMQVFFVISGYFSYMLFLRYPLKHWWKVRVERVGIPMLTAIPLLTLPQFILLQYVKEKTENWPTLSAYEKYNTLAWELISHLWFFTGAGDIKPPSASGFLPGSKKGRKQASLVPPLFRWPNFRLFFSCWGWLTLLSGALYSSYIRQSSVTACSILL
ncbi:glucans biosynthesis protein [Salmonella enterica subsp. enterica]|uniref:Glucans biosynthesis protein n=1 Tax=Salmonella enterica I TaxID=59201 RepID=A0A3S4I5G7_SALET|nr:glucans biosynthesis protein [Salmonella enterica subsp. enterica]